MKRLTAKICPGCSIEHNRRGVYCSIPCCTKNKISWNAGKTGMQVAWNKGLSKDTDTRVKKQSTSLSAGGRATGIGSTPEKEAERKRKQSLKAIQNKNGGYIPGSGRGKCGWYKGFWCDSSWELAYVIYCIEHDITIERNKTRLSYVWEDKERKYIPDFLVEGVLTEIKGYSTPQWQAKVLAYPEVVVLYEKELRPIIMYVKQKYGNDFIKLYEQRKYSLNGKAPGSKPECV